MKQPGSGKKRAHKHTSFWPVIPVRSRSGGQGSDVHALSSEPKEHKTFCPGTRPGEPVTGKGRKKHINFFNISFLAPTQNPQFWAPRKKFMCLISWERAQKGTHINFFGGIFGVKKGVPNGRFSTTKSLVYCFFPAPNRGDC